jgi:hypothetical protein
MSDTDTTENEVDRKEILRQRAKVCYDCPMRDNHIDPQERTDTICEVLGEEWEEDCDEQVCVYLKDFLKEMESYDGQD